MSTTYMLVQLLHFSHEKTTLRGTPSKTEKPCSSLNSHFDQNSLRPYRCLNTNPPVKITARRDVQSSFITPPGPHGVKTLIPQIKLKPTCVNNTYARAACHTRETTPRSPLSQNNRKARCNLQRLPHCAPVKITVGLDKAQAHGEFS